MRTTVCILTAGHGTRMGHYSKYINKSLLPIGKKAIISNIIEKFPKDTEFVIALGYLKEQVQDYIKIAHGDRKIKFTDVDNFDREGSGPGYSLLCCKDYLQRPFYFISCDTLWEGEINFSLNENWFGVSEDIHEKSDQYCNMKIENGFITAIRDKEHVDNLQFKPFIGLCYIKDVNIFWKGLQEPHQIAGEHQISNGLRELVLKRKVLPIFLKWTDVGSFEGYKRVVSSYEDYDFSKINEFLYIVGKKVIKFFADPDIVEKRVKRSTINQAVFPMVSAHFRQFYAYDFIEGKTLYQQNNYQIFKDLLAWLDKNLWIKVAIDPNDLRAVCKKFYYDKTIERILLYEDKYKYKDKETRINGCMIPSTRKLLDSLPCELLYEGVPTFIHGDLQFDNIIYNEVKKNFILLDWRQNFGGYLEFGDIYYDLSKLYGGIILNYDYIKKNLINYSEDDGNINFDFAQGYSTSAYLEILSDFIISRKLDLKKVRLLVPIIYLNMSPLHHYPFDKMLYNFGRFLLYNELGKGYDNK